MKVYISGPVSLLPNWNSTSFKKAVDFIMREAKSNPLLEVVNPLDIAEGVINKFKKLGIETPPTWEDFMREDIKALMDASCVFFLPGWEKSRGAVIEHFIAHNLEIPCFNTKAAFKNFLKKLEERNEN